MLKVSLVGIIIPVLVQFDVVFFNIVFNFWFVVVAPMTVLS